MSDSATPAAITPSVISSGPSEGQLQDWFGLSDTSDDAAASGSTEDEATADEADTTPADPSSDTPEDITTETPDAPADEKPAAERKASLPFTVIGADGKPLDEAALGGIKVELKGAGKKEALTLADVVRRASSEAGAVRHAHKVEGTLNETLRQQAALQEERDGLAQERETLRDIARRAVLDADFREELRAELEEYESPENELARLKQDKARESQSRAQQEAQRQLTTHATQFFEGSVVPAFDTLLKNNPTLSFEEVLGRFHTETAGLSVNGVIPPKHYAKVQELLSGSLATWAKSRNGERAKLSDTARSERANAQAAKNRAARAVAPSNGASHGASSITAPKPNGDGRPLSYKDAAKYALSAFTES